MYVYVDNTIIEDTPRINNIKEVSFYELINCRESLLTKFGSQALRSAVISLKPKCVELLVRYGAGNAVYKV